MQRKAVAKGIAEMLAVREAQVMVLKLVEQATRQQDRVVVVVVVAPQEQPRRPKLHKSCPVFRCSASGLKRN